VNNLFEAGNSSGLSLIYLDLLMADALNLSLWFPQFEDRDMMPRMLSVLRQFPFSSHRPGIAAVAVYPFSASEAPVYAQNFEFQFPSERAVQLAGEFLHDDYAYEFEGYWDLWEPVEEQDSWLLRPANVRFIAHGPRFEDGLFQQAGHIQVDFGPDLPFLYEEEILTGESEVRVRANVQKLVNFTTAVEKNCGISGRVLWSESEENLAQKLISRLQKVH
jgi:hypothetical protein